MPANTRITDIKNISLLLESGSAYPRGSQYSINEGGHEVHKTQRYDLSEKMTQPRPIERR